MKLEVMFEEQVNKDSIAWKGGNIVYVGSKRVAYHNRSACSGIFCTGLEVSIVGGYEAFRGKIVISKFGFSETNNI